MRILLVDDEKLNRMVIGRILESAGYEYHGCGSGEEALDYIADHPCDLVLMDRQMPGIDGIETTRKIRGMGSIEQPKIISFSAYTDDRDRQQAFDAGMDAVISKPVTLDQLQAAIRDIQDS